MKVYINSRYVIFLGYMAALALKDRHQETFIVLERIGGSTSAHAEVAEIQASLREKAQAWRGLLRPVVRQSSRVGLAPVATSIGQTDLSLLGGPPMHVRGPGFQNLGGASGFSAIFEKKLAFIGCIMEREFIERQVTDVIRRGMLCRH